MNTKKKNEVHFYDGIKWMINRMGQLLAWRTGHRSLVDGRRIIHVGGNYMNKVRLSKEIKVPLKGIKIEVWTHTGEYNGEALFEREPSRMQLEYWGYWPNAFVVQDNDPY